MTYLSIIIPAHNEANRLPKTLVSIDAYMSRQKYSYEIIVVENGSNDDTVQVVNKYANIMNGIRLISIPKRGKGIAVKTGMLEAKGEFRFMCDADLSMPINDISRFFSSDFSNYDIAIGSREVKGSRRFNEPVFTHIRGRIFSNLVKIAALPGFEDTQCGFKCFRAPIAIDLFGRQRFYGMSFDVEILFIATKLGYDIVEIPINWYFNPETRVRMVQDSFAMLKDIMVLRKNWQSGLYDEK
tara:strand:- start:1325 stop:2047 length:723 start_codon:yes stop_codon:yes gene_type:complete